MWLILAFMSAALLGCYDSFKKAALRDNAVIPVLFLNTVFCSLLFLPLIVLSAHTHVLDGSIFHVASGGWEVHRYVVLKSLIVLSSWIFGYIGMKNLPLTIVGPINATRPVMVLIGALLVFGERLNRTHQCHTTRDGAHRRAAGVWRAAERLSVDWCAAGRSVVLHAQP